MSLTGTSSSVGYRCQTLSAVRVKGKSLFLDPLILTVETLNSNLLTNGIQSPFNGSPSGLGFEDMLPQDVPNPSYDSVLVFDTSQGANGVFAHQHLKDFRAPGDF